MAGYDEHEDLIAKLFRRVFKFQVEKIPEGHNRTADFILSDGILEYLIELKTRRRRVDDKNQRRDQLASRVYSETAKRIERNSNVSKLLSEAIKQIESTTEHSSALRLVFFLLRDFDAEERWQNIITGIYGIRHLVDNEKHSKIRKCYYFSESDFYRYRNRLDGVILFNLHQNQAQLCLNDHSPKYSALKSSALAKGFNGAVIDPLEFESQGKILITDGAVNRADESNVISFLRKKYNLSSRTMTMDLGYYSASVLVPNEVE